GLLIASWSGANVGVLGRTLIVRRFASRGEGALLETCYKVTGLIQRHLVENGETSVRVDHVPELDGYRVRWLTPGTLAGHATAIIAAPVTVERLDEVAAEMRE